jgi:putative SOS response-associated peptidase YedK
VCNLYSNTLPRSAIIQLARALRDRNDNQPPQPGIYPDYPAPVIVIGEDGQREMRNMRWGMPSPQFVLMQSAGKRADKLRAKGQDIDKPAFAEMLRLEPDSGVTNVRKTDSKHWTRWLTPGNRCLVPFTSFAEPDQDHEGSRKNIWFALDDTRPLAFFAGVWTPHQCVRKAKAGWEEIEAFGFLTTDSAEPVKTYHTKAMPVILTTEEERDLWLSNAPWEDVKRLQRPLPDGLLKVVSVGGKQDNPAEV